MLGHIIRGRCRWSVILTAFLRRSGTSQYRNKPSFFHKLCGCGGPRSGSVWGKKRFLLAIGAFGQLLLRIPRQSFTCGGQFLEREGQPSVSCSALVPDRENRCLGSRDRDLAAAGRGSPLERRLSSPFPSSLAELFSLETTNASQLHFWEFA